MYRAAAVVAGHAGILKAVAPRLTSATTHVGIPT